MIRENEKQLVYREKERQIIKLELQKRNLELKYLHGEEHWNQLSVNKIRDRKGMLRELEKIPASSKFKEPFHKRANSVQPSNVFEMTGNRALLNHQSSSNVSPTREQLVPLTTQSSNLTVTKRVGDARFTSRSPIHESILDDPMRYIKQRAGDKKEGVKNFAQGTRQILYTNINMMSQKIEIMKLKDMIDSEETKLQEAIQDFEEETARFQNFIFDNQKQTENVIKQTRIAEQENLCLGTEITTLKNSIRELEHEISLKEEVLEKHVANKDFIEQLIQEFRPNLLPEGGLQPMPKDTALANAKFFMTEEELKDLPKQEKDLPLIKMQEIIPITKHEVHNFVQEMCNDTLFQVEINNQEQLQGENKNLVGKEKILDLEERIQNTDETIKSLEDRRRGIIEKILKFDQQIKGLNEGATVTKDGKLFIQLRDEEGYNQFTDMIIVISESLFGKKKTQDIIQSCDDIEVQENISKQQASPKPKEECESESKKLSFKVLIKMLGLIEGEMHKKVEFYDRQFNLSKKSMKAKQIWKETLSKADEELKLRQYNEAQRREDEAINARLNKNLKRLHKTQNVTAHYGKKEMFRSILNVKRSDHHIKDNDKYNPDVLKYLGSDEQLRYVAFKTESEIDSNIKQEENKSDYEVDQY